MQTPCKFIIYMVFPQAKLVLYFTMQMYKELDVTDYFVLVVECFIGVIKITYYIFTKSFYSGVYYIYLFV